MYGYIYKFTFLPTNDFYVGQHRYENEIDLDESYWGGGKKWTSLISQYPKKDWPHLIKREILEWCDSKNKLDKREIYWIDKLNARFCGLNISVGGNSVGPLYGENNPFYGRHHTDETKAILREKSTGRVCIDLEKEKIRKALILKWQDDDYRERVISGVKEALNRPEIKAKRSIIFSGSNNSMSRKVLCIETGEVFNLVKDATKWLKNMTGHGGAIGRSCKTGKATMGYHFKYCDNKNPNYASGRKYNYVRTKDVTNKVSESLHIYHSNKNKNNVKIEEKEVI